MLDLKKTLIITFNTTTDVMLAESAIKKQEKDLIKIISIPSQISAGCGLVLASKIEMKEKVLNMINKENIKYDKIYEIEI